MLSAACCCLNTFAYYLNIDCCFLSIFGGMSILTWVFIFLASIVFKFCIYHRLFLYYILVTDTLNTIDYTFGIPIETFSFFTLDLCITGIFLFLILYLYVKTHKKYVE